MLDFVLPNIDDKMTKIQKIQRTSFILEIFKANLISLILSENHTYIVILELFSSQTQKKHHANERIWCPGFQNGHRPLVRPFCEAFFFSTKNSEDGKNKNSNGNEAREDEVARGK